MMPENKIVYNNMDLLKTDEQEKAKKVFETKFAKLQRLIKNDVNLIVNLKVIEKQGPKKQYFFHLKTESAAKDFAVSPKESDQDKLVEWDVTRAATKSMDHLLSMIEHRYSKLGDKKVVKHD